MADKRTPGGTVYDGGRAGCVAAACGNREDLIVVPDSGTGELTGLSGKMQIVIDAGKHSYVFDYTLP